MTSSSSQALPYILEDSISATLAAISKATVNPSREDIP